MKDSATILPHSFEASFRTRFARLRAWRVHLFVVSFLLLFIVSCATFRGPVCVVALHLPLEGQAKETAIESGSAMGIADYQRNNLHTVSIFSLISSRNFTDAVIYEDAETHRWGVKFTLDRLGLSIFGTQVATLPAEQDIVILLDGFFQGKMKPVKLDESNRLVLPPLWLKNVALRIAENTKRNYSRLN